MLGVAPDPILARLAHIRLGYLRVLPQPLVVLLPLRKLNGLPAYPALDFHSNPLPLWSHDGMAARWAAPRDVRCCVDDNSRPQSPVDPAVRHQRMALAAGPLSLAAVWAALPATRREPARDYLAQDRLAHCFRRGRAYLAVLRGHQDVYHVYCEDGPDVWQVGCTCGRRLPCAHAGALLFAIAQDPTQFAAWTPAARRWQSQADWAWDWACGGSFPWAALSPDQPLAEPAAPDAPLPASAEALGNLSSRQLKAALPELVAAAHPSWWEHQGFLTAVAGAFQRLTRAGPDPAVQVEWIHRLAEEPRIPCGPLFPSGEAPNPAAAAAWRSALWARASAHALDPRPSQALAVRALLALTPLAATYPEVLSEFAWALPDGLSRAELLLRQSRAAEAWWHLSDTADGKSDPFHPTARDPYRQATQRLAASLITGEVHTLPGPQE